MKFIVIGCGLMGVTTAYFLRSSGHEVTVVDCEDGAGQGASFANGALLTPSMPEPWNGPGCWRSLLSSLGRSDSPLQLRLRTLPSIARWGAMFLRNSNAARHGRNTLSNLRLALHSLEVMRSLRQNVSLEYGRAAPGTLRLFRKADSLDRATEAARRLANHGLEFSRLSRKEVVGLEPALLPIADQLEGALHYRTDETGDAYRFCVALAHEVRRLGVECHFGTRVSRLERDGNRIVAAVSEQHQFVGDQYIVTAGSHSAPILKRIGVHLPVQPAKGYSLTIDNAHRQISLSTPIVDDDWHAAIVPLEKSIRVAGTAEFAGYDKSIAPARISNLLKLLLAILPQARVEPTSVKSWCGLRPMSVDGVPVIGRTAIANLFLNTGHGHLGWTMAAGSASLLTEILSGCVPSIDPAPYSLDRFGLHH